MQRCAYDFPCLPDKRGAVSIIVETLAKESFLDRLFIADEKDAFNCFPPFFFYFSPFQDVFKQIALKIHPVNDAAVYVSTQKKY